MLLRIIIFYFYFMELLKIVSGEKTATLVSHMNFYKILDKVVDSIICFMFAELLFKFLKTELNLFEINKFSCRCYLLLNLHKCVLLVYPNILSSDLRPLLIKIDYKSLRTFLLRSCCIVRKLKNHSNK
jgi:hypothetical protein